MTLPEAPILRNKVAAPSRCSKSGHPEAGPETIEDKKTFRKGGAGENPFAPATEDEVSTTMTASSTNHRKALWVGGPPGKTLDNIVAKLAVDFIDVVSSDMVKGPSGSSSKRIPKGVDLVLVNCDMISHAHFDQYRAAAKAQGVECVSVRTQYSRTRETLLKLAIVEEKPAADRPDDTAVGAVGYDDVEAFVRALNKDMRAWAVEVARTVDNEEASVAADAAVAEAMLLLGTLNDDVLLAALKRAAAQDSTVGHVVTTMAAFGMRS